VIVHLFRDREEWPPVNEWQVWVSLQDGNPAVMTESFCIGVGETVDEAATAARKALDKALDDLVVLAHDQGATVAR
jgi:hypothetical protein